MTSSSRASLWTPHFLLLFSITFVTFLAAFQMFPTVPLRLRQLGASLAETGQFMAAFTAGSSLGALFTGPLGDRLGQRRMMVACALGFAAFIGSYSLLTHRLWFVVLAFPHGVVWSGLLTATMATLGGILPAERRADGMSIYGLASPGGAMLGPLIGVALFDRWGFGVIGGVMGALFVGLAFLCFSLPADRIHETHVPWFRMPERLMVAPCMVLFTSALGYGALNTYTVQEGVALGFGTVNLLGLKVPLTSAFLSLMAFGMVFMRLVMSAVGFGTHPVRLLPWMMGGATAALGLLALLPGGLLRHALAAPLYGAGYSMMHTLVSTYVLNVVHPERRGTAFGATLFSFDSGIGLGNLLLGAVIGHIGFRWGWALAACCTLIALAFSIPLVRRAAAQESR